MAQTLVDIRHDRFLDPNNADAYFKLIRNRLNPGEFVVLRLNGSTLRLVQHSEARQQ